MRACVQACVCVRIVVAAACVCHNVCTCARTHVVCVSCERMRIYVHETRTWINNYQLYVVSACSMTHVYDPIKTCVHNSHTSSAIDHSSWLTFCSIVDVCR